MQISGQRGIHGVEEGVPMATGQTPDCPGVIARPPRLYLGFLAAGVVLHYVWPLPVLPAAIPAGTGAALGIGLLAVGVAVMALAMRQFRRAGTPVETHRPTTALVTDNLFGRSRNPIYVSLTLMQAGLGVALNNGWVLGLLVPLLVLMRYGVVRREERYLERKFGAPYVTYKASVRRWL